MTVLHRATHRFYCLILGLAAVALAPATSAHAANCSDPGVNISVVRESSPVLYFDPASNQNPKLNASYVQYTITNNTGSAIQDLWVKLQDFSGTKVSLSSTENGITHVGAFPAGATKNVYFLLAVSGTGSSQTHNVGIYPSNPSVVANTCLQNFSYSTLDAIAANANKVTGISISPNPPQLGGLFNIVVTGDTGTIGAARIFSTTPSAITAWLANAFELTNVSIVLSGGNSGTVSNDLFFTLANAADTHYVTTFTFRAKAPTSSNSSIYPVSYISSGTQIKHTDTGNLAALGSIQPVTNQVILGTSTASPGQSPSCLGGGGGTSVVSVNITNNGSNAVTLDDIVVTLPTSPATVTLDAGYTETFDGTALPVDPVISGHTVTWYYQFTVPAGSTKTLQFQVNIPATNGSYTIRSVGHIDTTAIDTSSNTTSNSPANVDICVGPTPTPTSTPTSTPASSAPDSDGDGIPNSDEGSGDSDGDGTKDKRDTDSDNDGIPDSTEGDGDTDDDGVPDYRDRDSDNDGIPDIIEGGGEDSDGDGQADDDKDTDDDGLPDTYDPDNGGTPETVPDTDGDGIPDYKDEDSDGDGIRDRIEGQTDDNTRPPSGNDEDGDGIDDTYDYDEDGRRDNPPPDGDGDGVPDYQDPDSDNDGNSDTDEAFDEDGDGNPDVTPGGTDSDGDGLDDEYEDYRRFNQLDDDWRAVPESSQCTRRRGSLQVTAARRAAQTLNSRAAIFAAKAKACGGADQTAGVERAAAAYGRLITLLSKTYSGLTYSCPTGVCAKNATARANSRLLKLAAALTAEAKAVKLNAIGACRTPPSTGDDPRKNNDDYLADLKSAINGLPKTVTRCSAP